MTVRRPHLLLAMAALAALAVCVGPAQSAFPGTNGKIAFASDRDGNAGYEIYVMNADGSGQTRLTTATGHDQYPVWSANGNKIVFSSAREGNDKIFTMNADGSGVTRITDSALNHDVEPSWSPDGSKIAFRSDRVHSFQIWVVNADGTGLTQLTDDPSVTALRIGPVWSPDGSKILFASSGDGDYEIFVMNADGTGQTQLTSNTASDTNADWSPDGTKIAYQSDVDGDFDVYVMNADGSGQTQLTNDPLFDSAPSWSPDGSKIAFQSSRDGDFEILVMNADGSGQTPLTLNTALDRVADWQPVPSGGGDTTSPVLTVPGNITADATVPAGAVVGFVATATDNIDPSPSVVCAPTSGSTFPIGSTAVTCTATDASGNSSNGAFTVTVRDARAQLESLLQDVIASSALPPAVKAALVVRLQSLLTGFDPTNPGHRRIACRSLGVFVAIVQLLQGTSPAQVAAWIADANQIRAVLGC